MAISIAHHALKRDKNSVVSICLNVHDLHLADQNRLPVTEGNSERNIYQTLIAFLEDDGAAIACPSCPKRQGLNPR